MSQGKSRVPPALQKLLEADVHITKQLVRLADKCIPLKTLKFHYKALEISCHGIPWFACWLAFMWIITNDNLVQMQINMLLGLILDIIFVGIIKAYTRRRRPASNSDDDFLQLGPDKFSFPSGHATRSVFIAYFFMNLYPLSMIWYPPLMAWVFCICLSRLMMRRHHLLDIVAGIFLGLFEGVLMGLIWLDKDTCMWMWSSLTDDRLEGGEYHV